MIYGLVVTIHIIVCFFIIIVVLLQSGKSGDISAAFGGWGCQRALEGYHLVGGRVHGDVHYAVDLCLAAHRSGFGSAGREVTAGENAARAEARHATTRSEIVSHSFAKPTSTRPSIGIAGSRSGHAVSRLHSYRFRRNCISTIRVLPSESVLIARRYRYVRP